MKSYGSEIAEGGSIKNLTAPSGTSFPTEANLAEFFYRTDEDKLYVCTSLAPETWTESTNSAAGGDGYIHTEAVAATTWTISHNLNETVPSVTVWIDAGSPSTLQQALPESIVATDANTVTLTFSTVQSGKAIIISGSNAAGGESYNIVDNSDATFLTVDSSENVVFAGILTSLATESKSASGYVKLPSGIIIQWGTNGATTGGSTHNFPLTFPTSVFSIVAVNNNQTDPPAPRASLTSTSQFNLKVAAGSPQCYWIAIGY